MRTALSLLGTRCAAVSLPAGKASAGRLQRPFRTASRRPGRRAHRSRRALPRRRRLEGRETGTRGYDLAADTSPSAMRRSGLQPAGDDGSFFQRVPLLKAMRQADRREVRRSSATGARSALHFNDEYLPAQNYNDAAHALTAPAVFVGQGVYAPELQHDDFAGVDLKGKIAVMFSGAPARFDNDRRAFYSSSREKLRALAERGAVGVVVRQHRRGRGASPWSRSRRQMGTSPACACAATTARASTRSRSCGSIAYVSAAAADVVLRRWPADRRATVRCRRRRQAEARSTLPGTLTLAGRTRDRAGASRATWSRSWTAAIRRWRPSRRLSPRTSTTSASARRSRATAIYNGALDNALGVAVMLEAARELAARRRRAEALAAVRRADRRGKRPAGRGMVRDASDRAARRAGRQHQHGHAGAAGADPRRGADRRRAFDAAAALVQPRRRRSAWRCRRIRSRRKWCSCAATSTPSSAPACRRCTWTAA